MHGARTANLGLPQVAHENFRRRQDIRAGRDSGAVSLRPGRLAIIAPLQKLVVFVLFGFGVDRDARFVCLFGARERAV